ncbi:MAG: ribbon-helix-helix protein, CopG family [Chloroflexi bacterium]|nr:ribbon-helix-helix protein, CopG family [Chloroflexota bacterium]
MRSVGPEPSNEEVLAEYFEQRRGKTSFWAKRPSRAKVRKGGTVIFSMRLALEELELLRAQAAAQGVTVSELIRRALQSLRQGSWSSPNYWSVQDPSFSTANISGSKAVLTSIEEPKGEFTSPPGGQSVSTWPTPVG